MTLATGIKRFIHILFTIAFLAGAVSLPQLAMADITCCIFQNGAPCVNVCYVTDLTCADITIGFMIQSCTDMIANGGGGGAGTGGAVLENIHTQYDGQVNIGNGPFSGTVELASAELNQFFITRPVSPHENLDQSVQVLGITATGELYLANVPTAGLDRFAGGDLVIQATRGSMEISAPLTSDYSGRMAAGDITLTVAQIDRTDNMTVLSAMDTAVNFSDLVWTFVDTGVVSTEKMSWGAMKAQYSSNGTTP